MDEQGAQKGESSVGDRVGPKRCVEESIEVGPLGGDGWDFGLSPRRRAAQKFVENDTH